MQTEWSRPVNKDKRCECCSDNSYPGCRQLACYRPQAFGLLGIWECLHKTIKQRDAVLITAV